MRLTKKELLHYWSFQEFCNLKQHYDRIIHLPHTGDHCCVFFTESEVIISIDATDGKFLESPEWKSNMDFNPPIRGFHRGLYQTAKLFFNQLLPIVEEVRKLKELVPITVIGHSRGGGIAPIIEMLLKEVGFGHIRSIPIANPRYATVRGLRALKKAKCETHRVEAKLDFVDNMPPKITLFPFNIWTHYQTEHYQLPGVEGNDHTEILKALEAYDG